MNNNVIAVRQLINNLIKGLRDFTKIVTEAFVLSTTTPTTKVNGQIWFVTNDMYYKASNTEFKLLTDVNVYDVVGTMVTDNVEKGIAVTYDNINHKLDFDVNDFSITLTDMVTGSGTVTDLANVSFATTVVLDTDGLLTANSDTVIPSQKAIKTYADNLLATNDALIFKGVIDCSTNPNYPAASTGHTYRISVAGKIGGASGLNVEVNDTCYCTLDNSPAGDQATVGANWVIVQTNLDGAVIGPASATDSNVVLFDGITGKLIKNSTITGVDVATAVTNNHTHSNKSTLDNIQEALTTALKSAYDAVVSWKTSTDALSGILKCNGSGTYSAITDSSTNWNTAFSDKGYSLLASCSSSTPADSTTYYFGGFPSIGLVTTAAVMPLYIPRTGTITKAFVVFYHGAGTTEESTMSIRVNNTTDYAISAVIKNDALSKAFNNTSLDIDVTAGDYIEIKWATPAWATNPTVLRCSVILWIV